MSTRQKMVFVLIFVVFFLLGWKQTGMCAEKYELIILGIRLGSMGHMFATKINETINKDIPEVSATIVTGSSEENPLNVQRKRGHIGFTSAQFAGFAYAGEKSYENRPCKDIRFLYFFVMVLDNFLVRADSNIRKIEDLKDKKICVGPKGYTLTEGALRALEVYGLTPEIIRKNGGNVSFASDKDGAQMLQDKVIDAMFGHTAKSALISQILPIEHAVGLRPLPYDRDKLQLIIKKMGKGIIAAEIDGGIYKAEPRPVLSFATPMVFVIHKDVPDDIVYKITKVSFAHQKEIVSTMGPFYNPFKIENAMLGSAIPIHPGALKYFRDVGITK